MIEHLASLVAEQIWQLAAQGLGAGLSWTALGNVHWVHNLALYIHWTHTGLWTENNNFVHSEH